MSRRLIRNPEFTSEFTLTFSLQPPAFLPMHADLQYLIQLQDLDTAADRARRRIADIPTVQEALDARLADRSSALAAVKARIEASQAERRETEKELAAIQTRLSRYKGQLLELKTNKEYQAMQKEMTVAEREVRAHEDKLIEHMERAESSSAELQAADAAFKADQADAISARKALETERNHLQRELETLLAGRAAIVANLSSQALMLFERIAHGRKGIAVAEARGGLCTLCHVRLRPQIFNEVRRNDGLHQCDSCTRILYYVPAESSGAPPQPS